MDIESIIAAASRAQQADDAGLGNCSRIWHVGFFFDGIHRNIDQDAPEQRLSNVARHSRSRSKIPHRVLIINFIYQVLAHHLMRNWQKKFIT
ncbi:hypothetical protein [Kluyvera sichuanensis]|uniref:hypothetical protein n=1 Tax=Kluyvera sichuanensis TaxID=2725494 RepID=UPI0039F514C8